jgi:hypothetical protein
VKANVHDGRSLKQRTRVMILTPINSRQYLSYAAHGRGNVEGTRRQCPYFRLRADLACAAVAQRALEYAQVTAGEVEKVSL